MKSTELVVDTDVVSFMFRECERGVAYMDLIGTNARGITVLSLAELRSGVTKANWGARRIASLDAFLNRFRLFEANLEIANLSGAIRGVCERVGRAVSWPDAWAAATALWFDVPLVAHDRDLEGIPGLRVLTLHRSWEVREEGVLSSPSEPLWLGEPFVRPRVSDWRMPTAPGAHSAAFSRRRMHP
jgi:predicted nucleic acid-binding protein